MKYVSFTWNWEHTDSWVDCHSGKFGYDHPNRQYATPLTKEELIKKYINAIFRP